MEVTDSVAFSDPAWFEECGGENGKPQSKMDAFAHSVRRLRATGVQVALMKFCFVDFDPFTDVDALFDNYTTMIDELGRGFPHITFAHVTTPLAIRDRTIKDRIKRLIRYPIWNDVANIKRSKFNERLQAAYPPELIFDLATVQSTHPNGSRERFQLGGEVGYSMVPAYTYDGGHLNRLGQRLAAIEFVRFLAAAVSRSVLNR
jgi:hypothetical protein